ncbi:MAG: hypothetical protein NTW19_05610 [Planctomycetota bacterium]|nr:hypothetical protein [Planctomycetota bacterium]
MAWRLDTGDCETFRNVLRKESRWHRRPIAKAVVSVGIYASVIMALLGMFVSGLLFPGFILSWGMAFGLESKPFAICTVAGFLLAFAVILAFRAWRFAWTYWKAQIVRVDYFCFAFGLTLGLPFTIAWLHYLMKSWVVTRA